MPNWTPTHKYHGEQGDRYGGTLQWPGANGFPFLGDTAPSLKQHEIEALPVVGRSYERVFDLNVDEDREYYNWVRDRIRNGMFVQDHIQRRWDEGKDWPVIYLEWTQCFVMAPPQTHAGRNGHGSSTNFTLRRPRES
jgi:hypothetical protein